MKTRIDGTKIRAIVLCAIALLCGGVLAALRIKVLFGAYDPATGLYPRCPDTAAFEIGMLALSLSLALGGLMFVSIKDCRIVPIPIVRDFSGALLGFAFLAVAVSTYVSSKVNMIALSRFDGVLIVFCLVCAASFFMEAFSKSDVLSKEAATLLMLFRPVCCLFISFYFYFDSKTVIHDSNKKMATLFFAAVLLSLLCEVKMKLTKTRIVLFASLYALSLCYSIMYAVPDLVWYFVQGDSLMLSVFFDVAAAALGIWSAVCILSISSPKRTVSTEQTESLHSDGTEEENTQTADGSEITSTADETAEDEAADKPVSTEIPEEVSEARETEI